MKQFFSSILSLIQSSNHPIIQSSNHSSIYFSLIIVIVFVLIPLLVIDVIAFHGSKALDPAVKEIINLGVVAGSPFVHIYSVGRSVLILAIEKPVEQIPLFIVGH